MHLYFLKCHFFLIERTNWFFLISFLWSISAVNAQESHAFKNFKEKNELGVEVVTSGISVYTPQSKQADFATEIHITYWLDHYWALGLGYTAIFEENGRVGHDLALLLSHKPWYFMTWNLGPSVSFPNAENDLRFSGYLESEFNFPLGAKGMHAGPVIGTFIGKESRYFAGFHIGLEF